MEDDPSFLFDWFLMGSVLDQNKSHSPKALHPVAEACLARTRPVLVTFLTAVTNAM